MAEQSLTSNSQLEATAIDYGKPRLFGSARFQENFIATVATLVALLGLGIVMIPDLVDALNIAQERDRSIPNAP